MKSIARKFKYLVIAAVLISSTSVLANWSKDESKMNIPIPADEVTGAWEYTVENVPYEYSKGVIVITKSDDNYTVKVKLTNGELAGEDVAVVGNSVTFKLYIEGQTVAVELTAEGDGITGKSTSYDGTFYIQGARQVE